MIVNDEKRRLQLLKKIVFFFCLFTYAKLSFSQDTELSLKFKNTPAASVLNSVVSDKLKFNFNHDVLPSGTFTFSFKGNHSDFIKMVSTIFDRKIVKIDQGFYTIQNQAIEANEKIDMPSYQGKVMDELGYPLPFCAIIVKDLDLYFETNENGNFKFNAFLAEDQEIKFKYLGYHTETTVSKKLLSGKQEIRLKQEEHMLGEIIVKDFLKIKQHNSLQNAENINVNNIDLAGSSDADILEISQLLPGVYNAGSLNDMQIRGGPPDQTSYKWNNIQTFQNSLFYGNISAFNPFITDEISVVKNGMAATESGQVSGSINMQTKLISNDTFRVKAFANLLYSNIGVSLPIIKDRMSIKAAYRNSFSQFYESLFFNKLFDQTFQSGKLPSDQYYFDLFGTNEFISLVPSMKFDDLSFVFDFKFGKRDRLQISYLDYGNQLSYRQVADDIDGLPSDTLEISNKGISIDYENQWTRHFSSNIVFSSSKYQHLYNTQNPALQTSRNIDNFVVLNNFKLEQTFHTKGLKVSAAYQFENWEVSHIDSISDPNSFDLYNDDYGKGNEHSIGLDAEIKLIKGFNIGAGLKWSDFNLTFMGRKYLEPRLHLSYLPTKNITLHFHYGQFHQNLNRRNLATPLDVDNGFWYLSDENVFDENKWVNVVENEQRSFGIKWDLNKWTFNADIYNKTIKNLWTAALDFSYEEDPYTFATMEVKGLELSAQFRNQWMSILWSYDYINESIRLWGSESSLNSPVSQPHRISLYQSFKMNKFTCSLNWRMASGRPYSSEPSLQTWTDNSGTERFYIEHGQLLEDRLPSNHQLDISIFYQIKRVFNKGIQGKLGLHILNAYNRRNIIKRQYFVDYRQEPLGIFQFEKSGLPFSPNLSVELIF